MRPPESSSAAHRGHTRARRTALQALYQWDLGRQNLGDIEVQLFQAQDMRRLDTVYFRELLHEIPAHFPGLHEQSIPCLDRPLNQVDPVERAILRTGAYEPACRPDIPWRGVINEAVELAKMFGGEQGHKYVSSVLDRLARKLRAVESASMMRARSYPAAAVSGAAPDGALRLSRTTELTSPGAATPSGVAG